MNSLGLYIHWPFCLSKCPYCDFNSHVREKIDQTRWREALLIELESVATTYNSRPLTSIFFGGGTPSLMDVETVASLLEKIRTIFTTDDSFEVTLEANPSSVEAKKFQGFADAGVNRLSLGVQSLSDDALQFLGRRHSAHEAIQAIEIAQKYFPRYSFDLIYARPDQNLTSWTDELKHALTYVNDHMSLYQLTIEPQTAFATRLKRGEKMTLDDAPSAQLYKATEELMDEAGLPAYEVSNYARPGDESLHNLLYWQGEEYLGIGPGAHGRIMEKGQMHTTYRHKAPETWLKAVENSGHGLQEKNLLSPEERVQELTLMGLRLKEGLEIAAFQEKTGISICEAYGENALSALQNEGLVEKTTTHLIPTFEGRLRLNSLIAFLLKAI